MKYSFANDYSEGCHPSILKALAETNLVQQAGYGDDSHTQNARQAIRHLADNSQLDVYMIAGGTLANLVVLSSFLRPFESVVAATTGHIFTNEAGAIEATGHKVEAVSSKDGKLCPENIKPLLNKIRGHHAVRTRAVYISNSTEIGTIYSKSELTALYEFCKLNELILFMDGARLPMALAAPSNDLTLADVAALTDIFYIGGTKCGALLGEAVVISNPALKKDFPYHLKQRGALMAKGRTIGIQFECLLRDNLIFDLAGHANKMAAKISEAFQELGFSLLISSDTNQVFPVFPNKLISELQRSYSFLVWENVDNACSVVRFITSWATPNHVVETFIHDLRLIVEQ